MDSAKSVDLKTYNGVIEGYVDLERRKGRLATALYTLAKGCEKAADFKAHCAKAEAYILSEDAGPRQVEDVPTSWKQAVSDIAAGMKLGLNPNEHPSYSAFKQAKVAANKASQEADDVDQPDKDGRHHDNVVPMGTPMPPDLGKTAQYLAVLDPHDRAIVVHKIEEIAQVAHDMALKSNKEAHKRDGTTG